MLTPILDKTSASRIIRALRNGATPAEYATAFRVGQGGWYDMATSMMMDTADDEDFEVRFIRAAYGGGKTLFLRCLEQDALEKGWAAAYVMLRRDQVELDRFETVVSEISKRIQTRKDGMGFGQLLRAALLQLAASVGYAPDKSNSLATLTKIDELTKRCCIQQGFTFELSLALRAAMRALIDHDDSFLAQLIEWFSGGTQPIEISPDKLAIGPHNTSTQARSTRLKPLGGGSADQVLRLISFIARQAGHVGLLLCFDEIELIAGLVQRRRDNAFQMIRALIDHTDPRLIPQSTCMFFAATPFMFEDRRMFPSYKALQDRIESLSRVSSQSALSYRAPIIDLDRTELKKEELFKIAHRITDLYTLAGKPVANDIEGRLDEIVQAITTTRYVIAKPRLLCRCVVDLLDGGLNEPVPQHLAAVTRELDSSRTKEIYQK